jgi:4-amino-4-deoxy-L-arabinose transferase-like glycosyltransferase
MAVSAALGLAHLAFLARSPLLTYLTIDLAAYDRWAREIAAGEWLGSGVFYQDPLYPYLMAVVYVLTGARVTHVLLLQVAASALTILLLYSLGAAVFSERVARVAAWMAALYGPAVFYAAKPEKACLSALGFTAVLWLADRAARRPSAGHYLALGALVGLVALLRANVLLLAIVLAGLVVFTGWLPGDRRTRLSAVAALAAGLALLLVPILVRNRIVGGDWVLTTAQAGANLFIGNHADNRTGSYVPPGFVRPSAEFEQEDFRRHAEAVLGHAMRPSEVSAFYLARVLEWAGHDPAAFLRLQAVKLRAFVNAYEIPDNWSIDFVRRFSPILRLPLLTFGIVFPLSVLGAGFVLWRRRAAAWLLILLAAYAATVVVFYVFSRYRYPMVFGLILLAAYALTEAAALVRCRAWPAVALSCVVVLAAAAAVHSRPTLDPTRDLSHRFYNLAASLFQDERLDDAEALCQRAVEIHAGNGLALYLLSQIAGRRGDAAFEDELLARAQAARPLDTAILSRRLQTLVARRDYARAVATLEQAIAQGRPTAATFQFLSNVHYLAGDRERAQEALLRGLALEPGNPLLLSNLRALDKAGVTP